MANYENILGTISMTKDNLYIIELRKTFSNQISFRKSELREFYRNQYDEFDENAFRRLLYSLEKDKIIIKVDTGVYILNNNNENVWQPRKKFIPSFSPELKSISNLIQKKFPYTKAIMWETRILHDFMLHQPGQNLMILEAEKEAAESIYNFLDNQFKGRVFLDPKQDVVDKYVLRISESIIITPMISRSPHQRVNDIPCPKLEKILVDIIADAEMFFMFHGQELVNIYKIAFHDYQVSEKTLFWYARRRKVEQKIRALISQKTDIKLIQQ